MITPCSVTRLLGPLDHYRYCNIPGAGPDDVAGGGGGAGAGRRQGGRGAHRVAGRGAAWSPRLAGHRGYIRLKQTNNISIA